MTDPAAPFPIDRTMSYAFLRATGLTRAGVRSALADGVIRRARRDVYLSASVDDAVFSAQRVGGYLDCLSAVAQAGVFVLDSGRLHVRVSPHGSRLRSPSSRRRRLPASSFVTVHWCTSDAGDAHTVPLVEALVMAVMCQPPRAAVAMLDSALFTRCIDDDGLREVFDRLPTKYRVLRPLVDGRAESGSESIARILLRGLGCRVQVQVVIVGVGRVDLLVDGWIVVECDSRAHHSGWNAQESDRLRDLALAERGYACIRPTARTLFTDPEAVIRAVYGLRESAADR